MSCRFFGNSFYFLLILFFEDDTSHIQKKLNFVDKINRKDGREIVVNYKSESQFSFPSLTLVKIELRNGSVFFKKKS